MRRNTAGTDQRLEPRVSDARADCCQVFTVASATPESRSTLLTPAEECVRPDLASRGIEDSGLRGAAEAMNKLEPK